MESGRKASKIELPRLDWIHRPPHKVGETRGGPDRVLGYLSEEDRLAGDNMGFMDFL